MEKNKIDVSTKHIENVQERDEKLSPIPFSLTTSDIIEHFDDMDTEILAFKVLSPQPTKEYLPSFPVK